jgi:zinc transporter ZupT
MILTTSATSFFLMIASASTLPLLAFLALLLRGSLFKGKVRLLLLGFGFILLGVAIIDTFKEHHEAFSRVDFMASIGAGALTLFILSRFSHGHHHAIEAEGAKGIVISEAFHSLIDGAVIGATYLVNPIFGYAATVGIIIHELPKIIGTLTLFRSIGLSKRKTVAYGAATQIGSPVAAMLVFTLGQQINESQFHALEIASISSLGAIVLWIMYLEIRFHINHRNDRGHDSHHH